MAFRGFLQELKSWTLGEIACAAGLVAFTAGAGYCVYRSLWGERAPPEHTQPPHEPVDLLGESSDTPTVLQVVEPILPLLPTETHPTSSAVVLPLSAGELNSTCCNVEYNTADSSLSQSEPVDIRRDILRMVRGPESRLCWLETAETHRLTLEGFPFQNKYEDSFPGIQVVEPNPQLLPNEHHQESSPILLTLDAGELISAFRNIQFLSACTFTFLSGSVGVKGYFLGMIRGPESRFCWFKTTTTHNFNHLGEYGKVTELISCKLVETSIFEPLEDYVQTLKKVFCTCLHVARDGRVNISTWEQEQVHSPHSDSEEQYDSEESDESLSQEEVEVPFISGYLTDRGVTDIGLKLHALREAFATHLACIDNQNFLFVMGKKIVMHLAAVNNQDAVRVKLAYEDLIWFLKTPSYQDSIAAELSEAYVYHYNFVDVFYELLLFGYITNGSIPDTFEGGLVERLFALISMWNVDVWEPAAKIYFTVLIVPDVHGEELTQPASMTVQPGQRLSIHCKVSYSVTSYHTAWIRQPAGKALEWIGLIDSDGGTGYSDKLKNKFSISRDTSTNTITIGGQNMQTEDTAVYYCARDPHSDTVSCSAAQKPHHYSLL
ncbi:hypothetical protein QTP70_019452 [Hemibagrus guttatus]|uniref:Ig-like domain-containing protein n=1 Tax=Hemibagrus guttatus TaxID=175788 RepID=A0AAE0UHE1_9TELE|nr:hypothetical protein QTP70_019452 [Hemibagrus guttatus]